MKKKVVAAVVTLAMMTVAVTGCSKQSEVKTADVRKAILLESSSLRSMALLITAGKDSLRDLKVRELQRVRI